ncbi:hypothetical protein HD553DRAFT_342995 [Filobasidium floriforme]|uniref:uncharacterized protein n=1 Tax=Filobasidium floriforme TaxID=5210 RepID=UPI001E8E9CC6|nr:uncharacterized protein HD553DRAFT_342995 [Filobasidium floriforme]KAH8083014.1 hypothetical protein HD553DRAFT_342995 [Filobasidium floriforme]
MSQSQQIPSFGPCRTCKTGTYIEPVAECGRCSYLSFFGNSAEATQVAKGIKLCMRDGQVCVNGHNKCADCLYGRVQEEAVATRDGYRAEANAIRLRQEEAPSSSAIGYLSRKVLKGHLHHLNVPRETLMRDLLAKMVSMVQARYWDMPQEGRPAGLINLHDPDLKQVATLYFANKQRLINEDEMDKDIGAFHKWARTSQLLHGKDTMPNASTLSLILEIRADLVEPLEMDDLDVGPVGKAIRSSSISGYGGVGKAAGGATTTAPRKRYISKLPPPQGTSSPPFTTGKDSILVYQRNPSWDEGYGAIEWEEPANHGVLWLDTTSFAQGTVKACFKAMYVPSEEAESDGSSAYDGPLPTQLMVAKEIKEAVLPETRSFYANNNIVSIGD